MATMVRCDGPECTQDRPPDSDPGADLHGWLQLEQQETWTIGAVRHWDFCAWGCLAAFVAAHRDQQDRLTRGKR